MGLLNKARLVVAVSDQGLAGKKLGMAVSFSETEEQPMILQGRWDLESLRAGAEAIEEYVREQQREVDWFDNPKYIRD